MSKQYISGLSVKKVSKVAKYVRFLKLIHHKSLGLILHVDTFLRSPSFPGSGGMTSGDKQQGSRGKTSNDSRESQEH